MTNNNNDILIRVLSNSLAQGIWAVILALLLIYFYRNYRSSYLKRWSWSWFALGGSMFFSILSLYILGQYTFNNPVRIASISLSIIGAYLHPLWLIIGCYELVKRKRFGRKREITFVVFAILLALITTLLFALSNEQMRVDVKSIIAGTCFFSVSIWLLRQYITENGIGHKIMTISFLIYGFGQIFSFFVVFLFFEGDRALFDYSGYFGLLELLLQVAMGVGMIVWLLEDHRKQLEKTHEELDSFLYSTSHDLKSPIASVLGLTHVAKVDAKHKDSAEYFEMIEKRIKKLDEIIEDILNYSKVNKVGITPEALDFDRLVKEVLSNVKFNQGASKISFQYETNAENIVNTSYNQIKIILNNLVSNAVKYHDFEKEHPFIKITFNKSGTEVITRVIDNGSGIEEQKIGQIFDMFYRATTKSEGSGLGLYIANEAALKIKGNLTVTSQKNVGTTFTLHFDEIDLGKDRV